MAWDSRGYYYRCQRVNGRPRNVYIGAGFLAELTARSDAQEQAQRAAQDAQRRLQKARDRAVHKDIDAQYRQVRAFVGELMTAAGYRQYNREWRKVSKKAAQLTGPTADGAPVTVGELVDRINSKQHTRADLDTLREILDAPETSLTILMGSAVANTIIDAYTSEEAYRLVMRADARHMAKMLGAGKAPAFELPLIEHIVCCWLRLQDRKSVV